MAKKKQGTKMTLNSNFIIVFLTIIFLSSVLGLVVASKSASVLNEKKVAQDEKLRPANIEVVVIQDSSCTQCIKLDNLKDAVAKQNVNITKDETLSLQDPKAKELMDKFIITKVPVMIVSGEITKDSVLEEFWGKIGKIVDNTFVLTQIAVPHVEVATGEVKGKTSITLLSDASCSTCYDVTAHEQILGRNFGLFIENKKTVDVRSPEGRELVKKYNIAFVPTVIIDGDVSLYPQLKSVWTQAGSIESDGAYVLREGVKGMKGTYKDLSTGKEVSPEEPKK